MKHTSQTHEKKRKIRDKITAGCIYAATFFSVAILVIIIGFIFINGISKVNWNFLTSNYNAETSYLTIEPSQVTLETPELSEEERFVAPYGIVIQADTDENGNTAFLVTNLAEDSPALEAVNPANETKALEKGAVITKIGTQSTEQMKDVDEAVAAFEQQNGAVRVKAVLPGGGIYPMLVTTLMMILLSLVIAIPIGVCAAIYLTEYAKGGRIIDLIRFATESLSGIPSIVFGLFGMLFFVKFLGVGQSILAGSLTLSILLLPTVIRTTEETLKTIPASYKEGSFGLGANKLQTLVRIVLPGAIPGILVAVILSIGRIVGESAALLFTAGTFASTPKSIYDSAATLTVRAYVEVKEYGNVEMASAIGVILIVIVLALNIISRVISAKLMKKRQSNG